MKKMKLFSAWLFLLMTTFFSTAVAESQAVSKSAKEVSEMQQQYVNDVNQVYIREPFHIWWNKNTNLNIYKKDLNKNNVPDVVEDIATQLHTARTLFHNLYKFRDPLTTTRMKEADYIDVILVSDRDLHNFSDENLSGFVWSYVFEAVDKDKTKKSTSKKYSARILLNVRNNFSAHRSNTPLHEYFHFLQFVEMDKSYQFLENWAKEGTAKWSEDLIADFKNYYVVKEKQNILDALENASKLNTYEDIVENIFGPFIALCGKHQRLPKALQTKYKYVNGTNVLKDFDVSGVLLIKEYLQCIEENAKQQKLRDPSSIRLKDKEEFIYQKTCLVQRLKNC